MRPHRHRKLSVAALVLGVAGVAGVGTAAAQPAGIAPPAPDTAPAPAPAPSRALVLHVPAMQTKAGASLRITAVIDAAWTEPELVVRYRPVGTVAAWREAPFERSSAGGYFATIPAEDVTQPGVEYWIAGRRADGTETPHFASLEEPHRVRVEPDAITRLADADRQRVDNRDDELRFDVDGHNFGNRYERRDDFLRGEATWTHRFWGRLYSVGLGFGLIEGKTPSNDLPGAVEITRGARYGFSEVRVRLARSIFVDGRATVGVTRNDLFVGAGGAVILGKPWAANVTVGAEALEQMGPTIHVRLQWHTAPPLLMGAAVIKSDLPGAELSNGLYIRYDLAYPVSHAITLRAALSYGSRDGASHFGGGLGTAFNF